jgi:hypothetical protein
MSIAIDSTDTGLTINHLSFAKNMQGKNSHNSELNPPENTTPSVGTTINGILILLPLSLLIIGLYFGVINP